MRLQVMICTFGADGLARVARMDLPEVEGVGYLVSCQMPSGTFEGEDVNPSETFENTCGVSKTCDVEDSLPEALRRSDIEVCFTPTIGLSINRNHALRHVTAPYALVADDDLRFYADGLRELIKAFDEHPEMDVALIRFDFPYQRIYPPMECELPRPYPNHHALSVEIALRMDSVRRLDLSFSPLMGIGAPYLTCGEEDMLVHNARRRGARVRFMPIILGMHPQAPTLHGGVRPDGAVRANGAVTLLQYPLTAALRLPLTAWRLRGGFCRNLCLLIQGAAYALKHKRQLT